MWHTDAFSVITHGRRSGNTHCKRLQREQCVVLDKCLMLNTQLNIRSHSFTNQSQGIADFCDKQKILFMCKNNAFHLVPQVAVNNKIWYWGCLFYVVSSDYLFFFIIMKFLRFPSDKAIFFFPKSRESWEVLRDLEAPFSCFTFSYPCYRGKKLSYSISLRP